MLFISKNPFNIAYCRVLPIDLSSLVLHDKSVVGRKLILA